MPSYRSLWSICAFFVTAVAVNGAWAQSGYMDQLCGQYSERYQETYLSGSARQGSVPFCVRPELQIAEPAAGCASLVVQSQIHFEEALMQGRVRICIIKLIEDADVVRAAEVVEGDLRCSVPWDAKLVKLADGTFACAKKKPDLVSILF